MVIDDNTLAGWERNVFHTKISDITGYLEFKDSKIKMQFDFEELSVRSKIIRRLIFRSTRVIGMSAVGSQQLRGHL